MTLVTASETASRTPSTTEFAGAQPRRELPRRAPERRHRLRDGRDAAVQRRSRGLGHPSRPLAGSATVRTDASYGPDQAAARPQRQLQRVEALAELVRRDRDRRQQADDVAVQPAGEQQQARSRARRPWPTSSGAGALVARSCTSSSASIGPRPRTSPTHGSSAAIASRRGAQRAPSRSARARKAGRDCVEHHLGRGAGHRVAAERAAEAARADGVHELGAAGDRRERQTAAERLARRRAGRAARRSARSPTPAGAADAGLDLVVDPEDAVAVAELRSRAREVLAASGRSRPRPGRARGSRRRRVCRVHVGVEELLERGDRVVGGDRRGTGTAPARGRPRARTARSPACRA